MTTHTALVWPDHGKELEIRKVETYVVKAKDVLIQVKATAINPADYKFQKLPKGVIPFKHPLVLGLDGAGIVSKIGSEVKDFAIGDRVYFNGYLTLEEGSFQEYTLQPSFAVGHIPKSLSFAQAATLPVGIFTTSTLLQYVGLPFPGENNSFGNGKAILIFGGAGSVGQYVIQFARISGFSTIISTASKHNESLLKDLGVTHFVDRTLSKNDQIQAIKKIVGDQSLFITDCIGEKETFEVGFLIAHEHKAKVGSVRTPPKEITDAFPDVQFTYVMGNVRTNSELLTKVFPFVQKSIDEGKLKPNQVKVVGNSIKDIPHGLELINKGVSGVKLVVEYSN